MTTQSVLTGDDLPELMEQVLPEEAISQLVEAAKFQERTRKRELARTGAAHRLGLRQSEIYRRLCNLRNCLGDATEGELEAQKSSTWLGES